MLTEEIKYLIVNPEGKPVAAYPDLKTAEIDAQDLSKDLPDKLVHIYELHNTYSLGELHKIGTYNFLQFTYKHISSYPLPPPEEPKPEGAEDRTEPAAPQPEVEKATVNVECEDCGALWPEGTEVCDDCGATLKVTEGPEAPTPAEEDTKEETSSEPEPEPEPEVESEPEPESEAKPSKPAKEKPPAKKGTKKKGKKKG